jgi:hypothetical protein
MFNSSDGYSVGMPLQPQQVTADVPTLGTVKIAKVDLVERKVSFSTAVITVPATLLDKAKTQAGMLEIAMLPVPDQLKSLIKVTKQVPVTAGSVPGFEFHSQIEQGELKIIDINRLFLVNDRIIGVTVQAFGAAPAETAAFFDSFRIGESTPVKADPRPAQTDRPPTKTDPPPTKADPTPPKSDLPQPTGAVPAGWMTFKSPTANYTIAMPQQPTEMAVKTPAGEMKVYVVKLPNKASAMLTMVIPVPADELAKTSREEFFRQMAFGIALTSGGSVSGEKKLSVGTNEGREFQLTTKAKQGPSATVYCRVYLVGNNCIVQQGTGTTSAPAQETAAFFNSLKIGN